MAARQGWKTTKPSSSSTALNALTQAEIDLQLALVRTSSPEGVYLEPDMGSPSTYHGVIFVRSRGAFQGGIFRFDLVFPPTFPKMPPHVYFPPTLLHPLLDPGSGRLTLAPFLQAGWDTHTSTLPHLLHHLTALFDSASPYAPEAATSGRLSERVALNAEVHRLARADPALYAKLAAQAVALSRSDAALYERGATHRPAAAYPSYSSSSSASSASSGPRSSSGTTAAAASSPGIQFVKMDEAQVRTLVFGASQPAT